MEVSAKKSCSCSHCLEQVLNDDIRGKTLKWEEYGRGDKSCGRCLAALKERMEKVTPSKGP